MNIVRTFRLADVHSQLRVRIDCTNHSSTLIASPAKFHILSHLPPRSACHLRRLCEAPHQVSDPLVFHTHHGADGGATSVGTLYACRKQKQSSSAPRALQRTKFISSPILVLALLAVGNVALIVLVSHL